MTRSDSRGGLTYTREELIAEGDRQCQHQLFRAQSRFHM